MKVGSTTITSRPITTVVFTDPTSQPVAVSSVTKTITLVYDPNRKITPKTGTAAPAGSNIKGSQDALFKNMCEGIKAVAGSISNLITLTKADATQYAANRKAMCPKNWCIDGVKQYINDTYPGAVLPWVEDAMTAAGGTQCNEFPFAGTTEGGNLSNGTRRCIPATDNNWQGGCLSQHFKKTFGPTPNPDFIAVGEKFVVLLAGWDCKTNLPDPESLIALLNSTSIKKVRDIKKRDVITSGISIDGGIYDPHPAVP
jgi:Deoxyribonuclease NucA/NucB